MNETKWLQFECQKCGDAIEAKEERLGKLVGCPSCRQVTKVELPLVAPLEDVRKAAPQRGPNGNGVPIKMGIPKVGSFEATVSKKKAGELAQMFLAGLLVVMGYIACAMFGVKPPKRG